jgi:hypothetical protein
VRFAQGRRRAVEIAARELDARQHHSRVGDRFVVFARLSDRLAGEILGQIERARLEMRRRELPPANALSTGAGIAVDQLGQRRGRLDRGNDRHRRSHRMPQPVQLNAGFEQRVDEIDLDELFGRRLARHSHYLTDRV